MPYTVGLFPNMQKDRVRAYLPDILALLQKHGLKTLLPQNLAQDKTQSYNIADTATLAQMDAGISLGGDGTFLQMSRYLSPLKIPVFGVNFGKLGFLAETEMNDFEKALQKLVQRDFEIEERSQLRATVIRNGQVAVQAHALNDMVVAKGHFSKLAHLELKINGKHSGIYAADGLIVATATGSTAYSLSAGGPMVHPSLDVSIITPICAHALYTRPLIIPGNNLIEITAVPPYEDLIEITAVPPYEELLLSADGEIASAVAENDIIRIDKNPEPVRLIRLNGRSYYETWQQKLMRTCGNEEAK